MIPFVCNILQTRCEQTHIATLEQWPRPQVAGSTPAVGAGDLNTYKSGDCIF